MLKKLCILNHRARFPKLVESRTWSLGLTVIMGYWYSGDYTALSMQKHGFNSRISRSLSRGRQIGKVGDRVLAGLLSASRLT